MYVCMYVCMYLCGEIKEIQGIFICSIFVHKMVSDCHNVVKSNIDHIDNISHCFFLE